MMASSMVTSERRWTSTRKSGMTVLGKVPKPINLPSQKLENHGLDPNVEIVPKGTLTWGSRPSLAASTAWGSSTLSSPKADGSVGSPIYGNDRPSSGGSGGRPSSGGSGARPSSVGSGARPSSGGSGARPSSGGSERSNEPTAIPWGTNSRPSSASGILPTCHMSVAANRPRSAETRPNSSQLSRFAERSGDSIAWGAAGIPEKLTAEASKKSDFSLSAGDFPTLGSEKNYEMKSQPGHTSRSPTSASGLYSTRSEISDSQLTNGGNSGHVVHGNFNSWSLDTHPDAGKDASTRMENWHMDHDNMQPQLIENMLPQQFVSLPDRHVHSPNGVWFGGHKTVGPYGLLGSPASYNMDSYYPYIPAGAIPNAQNFPSTEAIPGGVQLKDGKTYLHMPPESYIVHSQTAIPVRPGVYQGPFLYDGPYGTPHTSFDNSKQGVSTVGMQGQYGVHNQHPSENRILEPWKFHAQTDGYAPGMIKELKICGQANEIHGQSKILLKRHDSHEDKDTPAKNHGIPVWLTTQGGKKPGFSIPEGDLLANSYKQEQTSSGQQSAEVAFSKHADDSVHSNISSSLGTSEAGIRNVMKKPNTATTHINDIQSVPLCEKNASMGALNSKARIVDVQFEVENFPAKGKMKSDRYSSSDAEDHSNVGPTNTSSTSNTFISHTSNVAAKKLNISTEVISHESFTDLIPTPGQSDDQVLVSGKSDSSESGGHSQSHNQNRVRNSKARIADVQFEGENLPVKGKMKSVRNSSSDAEDHSNVSPTNTSSTSNTFISHASNVAKKKLNISTEVISHESCTNLISAPGQSDDQVIVRGKSDSLESGGHSQSHNQNRVQNIKARGDHHEKLKFGSYGDDEMKCTPKTESLVNISVAAGKSGHELSIPISHASQEAHEVQSTHLIFKPSSEPSSSDSVDHDVQHAKVKEMARLRAIQLQKKEEERTREQKAKALAKLDELNRRTLASSKQNLCHAQNLCNEGLNKHDTASVKVVNGNAVTIEAPCGSIFQDFEVSKQENDDSIKRKGDPVDLLFNLPPRTSDSSFQVSGTQQELSSSLNQDATLEIITGRASHLPDSTVSRRKQSNYRRKNVTDDSSQSQKLTNFENTENMKCVSMVPEDASNCLGILSCEDPPAVQPRKKNNRNPKYKNNLNDTQPNLSLPSSALLEGISGKSDGERDETKAPARVAEPAAVSEKSSNETMGSKGSIDLIAVPNQAGSEPAKVTSVKANNNWKPRPHRKPARNVQSNKSNSKCQDSETVVWAPVKVVNKNESSEEVQKSSASEVNDLSDEKNGLDMHSGAKARRAEMQRYVPKPVSKELSKQGGFLQSSSPSLATAASPDMIGKLDLASATAGTSRDSNSVVVKTALAFNYRNTEDTKQNRHAKTRTSWRQRNSGESPSHEQSALEGSLSFEPPKCIEKTSELQPSMPSDDDWHMEGGNGLQDEPTQLSGVAKNHGMSRQRRQQFKAHMVDRSSYAAPHNKVLQGGVHDKTEIQSPFSFGSGERNSSRTENQIISSDHMRSHWQPKSQVHPRDYLNAYKSSEGVRVADKLLPSQTTEKNHSGRDSGQRNNNIIEGNGTKHQEGNMERQSVTNHTKNQEGTREKRDMTQPLKSKIQSQEQELAIPTELAPVSADSNHEQHGLHRHAHYRGRFPRGRVASDVGSKGICSSGDVRNDDQQFEYHKSACYYKPADAFQQNPSASEEAPEAHRVSSSGARYGERGRNPARRGGHFYGPHCGAPVRASGAYNYRE